MGWRALLECKFIWWDGSPALAAWWDRRHLAEVCQATCSKSWAVLESLVKFLREDEAKELPIPWSQGMSKEEKIPPDNIWLLKMKWGMCFIQFYLTFYDMLSYKSSVWVNILYYMKLPVIASKQNHIFHFWNDKIKHTDYFFSFSVPPNISIFDQKKVRTRLSKLAAYRFTSLMFSVLKCLSRRFLTSQSEVCALFLCKGKTQRLCK